MKAQQIDMLIVGFGTDYALGTVDFHNAGLGTDKDVYTTKTKTATVANPYTLNASGRAAISIYADGWYKIIITKADGTGALTYDQLYYGVLEETDERHPTVRAITSSDTIAITDDIILANATTGAIVATLADASTFGDYQVITVKKQDATANTVTVDGYGTQTIDGATTKVLVNQYDTISIVKISATQWAEIRAMNALYADHVDTFDASATPAANTVLVSEADGYINATWIDPLDQGKILSVVDDAALDYLSAKCDGTTIQVNAGHMLEVKPATGITTAHLKSSSFAATITGAAGNVAVTGGQWCHFPQLKADVGTNMHASLCLTLAGTGTYATMVYLDAYAGGGTVYANFLYHTTSGTQVWVFRLRNKDTKKAIITTLGIDHPCFSTTGDPKKMPHPFVNYNPAIHEILVVTPSEKDLEKIIKHSGERPILETINEDYEFKEDDKADWPTDPIAIKGQEDPFFHTVVPVTYVVIEKEPYFILCRLKRKNA